MWTYLRQHPVAWSVPMSAAAVGAVLALHRDDPLFWSAWITIILGLWLARGQAKHFDSLITRLAHRGALQRSGSPIADDEVARLSADLEACGKELGTSVRLYPWRRHRDRAHCCHLEQDRRKGQR